MPDNSDPGSALLFGLAFSITTSFLLVDAVAEAYLLCLGVRVNGEIRRVESPHPCSDNDHRIDVEYTIAGKTCYKQFTSHTAPISPLVPLVVSRSQPRIAYLNRLKNAWFSECQLCGLFCGFITLGFKFLLVGFFFFAISMIAFEGRGSDQAVFNCFVLLNIALTVPVFMMVQYSSDTEPAPENSRNGEETLLRHRDVLGAEGRPLRLGRLSREQRDRLLRNARDDARPGAGREGSGGRRLRSSYERIPDIPTAAPVSSQAVQEDAPLAAAPIVLLGEDVTLLAEATPIAAEANRP